MADRRPLPRPAAVAKEVEGLIGGLEGRGVY